MKSNIIKLSVSILLFQFGCTIADNQNCNDEKLLNYVVLGEQNKIDACYKSGANILISSEGESIRRIALNNGHKELANYFIAVQSKEYFGNNAPLDTTTLWEAIEYNNVKIVQHYLTKGFDMNPKYRDGLSPIVYAVFNESNEVIDLLLNKGIEVGYEFDSRPLICIATMFNQLRTVKLLLKHGANVNDLDGSGVTPLMFAAREGNVEMLQFLIEKGADKTLREIRNETAYDMVKDNEALKKMLEI